MMLQRVSISVLVWAALASAGSAPQSLVSRANAALARLPLRFEANQGQWNADVRYAARVGGGALLLSSHGAVLMGNGRRVEMTMVDGNRSPRIEGLDPMRARTDYYIGKREHWREGIQSFMRVAYRSVYPGIDLIYYGDREKLEYDFVLAPGADAGSIRLRFGGAGDVRLTPEGDLAVESGGASFLQKRPAIYQEDPVTGGRRQVSGRYELLADRTVGVRLGGYDPSRRLVIDPAITYSVFVGGASTDVVNAVTTDANGLIYIGGSTGNADLQNYGTTVQAGYVAGKDGFVAVLDPTSLGPGTWVYFTYLGGGRDDVVTALSIDSDGNVVAAGTTTSSDFPVAGNAVQTSLALSTTSTSLVFPTDAFVTIFSVPNGLAYSTYYGGTANETPCGVVRTPSGTVYILGTTTSPDLPVTATAIGTVSWGPSDLFLALINPLSSTLVYGTYLGGESDDDGRGMAVGPTGLVYFAASTYSRAFPIIGAAYRGAPAGIENLVVGIIDPTQTGIAGLVSSTYIGGSLLDEVRSLRLDANGKLILTGWTASPDFPVTANAMQPALLGMANAFVMRVNPSAPPSSFLEYSTFLGGSSTDIAYDAISDAAGNIWATGYTLSPDFPVTPGAQQANYGNGIEAFLVKINPATAGKSALTYSTYLGGTGTHVGSNLALAPNGSLYLVGYTTADWSLPWDLNVYGGGASDGFVVVFK